MKLIIGLGNPSVLYHNTRHNIGKMFIEHLAKKYSLGRHRTAAKFQTYVKGNSILATS